MKKIVAFLLICILLCSIDYKVFASETDFVVVEVVDGNEDKTLYEVIKKSNDLLFSSEDLARLSGFEYKINEGNIKYTRGDKEVKIVIKNNSYTIGENLGIFTFENEIVNVDGKYYISGAEILPWLNVTCKVENGKLHITKDDISFWEIDRAFLDEKDDILFDFEKCCKELGVNSKWLKASSYVRAEGISGMFTDIIWVPFSSHSLGEQADYTEIFERILKEEKEVENAHEGLFESAEVVSASLSVIEQLESNKKLSEELKMLKKRSELFAKFENVVEGAMYVQLLNKNLEEELMWLNALIGNRGNYNYPEAMVAAAMKVESFYKKEIKAYFDKGIDVITDDLIEYLVDKATGEKRVEFVASVLGLSSALKPSWTEGVNNIGKYNSLAQCGIDVYGDERRGTHIYLIELQRAHAMFYLYGMEHNWSIMADYANEEGKSKLARKYEEKADKARDWKRKFRESADATINDSHEYGEGYCKEEYEAELRHMFEQLIYENNLRTLYKEFFYTLYGDSDLVCLKDITHDGKIDMIVVHKVAEQEYVGAIYTVKNDEIKMIYEKKGGTVHAGGFFNWYLIQDENGWNLAEEIFDMWQGMGHLDYRQYYVTNDGEVIEVNVLTVPATRDDVDVNGYVKDEALVAYKEQLSSYISKSHRIFYSFSETDAEPMKIETNPYVVFGVAGDAEKEVSLSSKTEGNDKIHDEALENYINTNRDYLDNWILFSAAYYLNSFGNIDSEREYAVYDIAAVLQILYRLDGGDWNVQNDIPVSEVERLLTYYTKSEEYSIEAIKKVIEGYEYIWYNESKDSIVFGGISSDLQGNPEWQYELLDSGNIRITADWINNDCMIFSQELVFTMEEIPRLVSYQLQ